MDKLRIPAAALLVAIVLLTACSDDGTPVTTNGGGDAAAADGGGEGGIADPVIEGRRWDLVRIESPAGTIEPAAEADVYVTFVEGRVSGSNGCNSVGGEYTLDGVALGISALSKTEIACLDGREVVALGDELALAEGAALNDGRLEITASSGSVLVFDDGGPVDPRAAGDPDEPVSSQRSAGAGESANAAGQGASIR